MAKKAKKKDKKKKRRLDSILVQTIAETLQANSDGEFELPSVLMRYTDKSHPKYRLGLHREMYVPSTRVSFYPPKDQRAKEIFKFQAAMVAEAIVSEGFPVKNKKFNLSFCEDCDEWN